ncbi:tRNA 2-selenouridine(34) synthase MnmH [Terrisporobacter glycolicus]|uniref:tRNA 2-selenouridine synthase n=1 Tax=Terrisporobacter glycolicus ATCC 14880 = DSM 1288 TaxID=1121315 RepID=A0ABZ2EXM5_9FIRM|nr:tRNA 2-selenouridine(34) synthase MnmH [Terrisporobacter glycolicus]
MKTIKIEDALKLEKTIFIDVRTEREYLDDHILNAYNMPLFDNDEYCEVGTIYKQEGKHEAIDKGFDFVSPKLKDMYKLAKELSSDYEHIVIYCARGGMRSGSVANLLSSIGIDLYKLEGGYKSYRNYVKNYLSNIMDKKQFIVLHGLTGVGKTELLIELDKNNIDMVDLEYMARNTGSVFGFITYDEKPPTQKTFETRIFESLFFSKSDYLFVESESKRVGHVLVPNDIYEGIIRDGYHILIECDVKDRVKRLCKDYIYDRNEDNIQALKQCINTFRKRLGNKTVDEYLELLDNEKYEELVEQFLVYYYDPLYMHSVNQYKYNDVIKFEDINGTIEKLISFHKTAMEGVKQC